MVSPKYDAARMVYSCGICNAWYDAYHKAQDCCTDIITPDAVATTVIGETQAADIAQQVDTVDATLAERGSRYGKFEDHAAVTQKLKDVLYARVNARRVHLEPDQREALDMICHKLGRIVNGDPDYDDSWLDIAGYAKLVADRLRGQSS